MAYWNLYFIAKLLLFFGGFIDFHVGLNLLFAIVLVPELEHRAWRIARRIVAIPVAVALLYHDTWFPPIGRIFAQASNLQGFTVAYLIELGGRFINPQVVAAMGVAVIVWWVAKRWLRITSFVFLAMLLGVPIWANWTRILASTTASPTTAITATQTGAMPTASTGPATNPDLDRAITAFFATEQGRAVTFSAPADPGAPFDIILLHICSLAWDDLQFINADHHPLLGKFDLVFRNFSSGASYSGPAAIRVLRGSCGQRPHASLYGATGPQCFLYHSLEQVGFEAQYAMNHDGHYGDFISDVQQRGEMRVPPLNIDDMPLYLKAFDDTPIRDDYAVLAKWWQARLSRPVQRVALYYNTISLHDGNHYPGSGPGGSLQTYKPRAEKLLADIDRFMQLVAGSGRKAAIVLIPEHGAALRGDKMQIAGMREIPGPRISLVPVGVMLVNGPAKSGLPLYIDKPTSYLAMSQLLANFIARNPFDAQAAALSEYTANLPSTEFVADNGDFLVQRFGGRYYLHYKNEDWQEYPQ